MKYLSRILFSCGVLCLSAFSYSVSKELNFKVAPAYYSPDSLRAISEYDFDNDGDADLFCICGEDNRILRFENIGQSDDVEFIVSEQYPSFPGADFIKVGDVTGDGLFDIIIAETEEGRFSYLKNTGSGFDFRLIYNSPRSAAAIEVCDINGDGVLDIFFSEIFSGVYLLKNNGSGNFERILFNENGIEYNSIKSGFLDSESGLDLLLASREAGSVEYMFARDNNEYERKVLRINMENVTVADFADIDSDGENEVFFGRAGTLVMLDPVGDTTEATVIDEHAGDINEITTGDFDSDGNPDIVFLSSGRPGPTVLNNENGTLTKISPTGNSKGFGMVVADFAAGTDSDLLYISEDKTKLSVLPNICSSRPIEEARLVRPGNNIIFIGKRKELIAGDRGGNLFYYPDEHNAYLLEKLPGEITKIKTADFNNDGSTDFVATAKNNNSVFIFENLGEGKFVPHHISDAAYKPEDIEIADYFDYNRKDILYVSYGMSEIGVLRQKSGFEFEKKVLVDDISGYTELLAGDFSADGGTSFIAASTLKQRIDFFYQSDKEIKSYLLDDATRIPSCLTKVDINNDNIPDFICVDNKNGDIILFLNNDGDFTRKRLYSFDKDITDIEVSDVDENGLQDVLVASSGSDELLCLLNLGEVNFTPLLIAGGEQGGIDDIAVFGLPKGEKEIFFFSEAGSGYKKFIDIPEDFPAPELQYPENGSENISLNYSLVWEGLYAKTDSYLLEVARDYDFSDMVIDTSIIGSETYNDNDTLLDYSSKYFWRVAQYGLSDTTDRSEIWSFRTEDFGPVVLRSPANNATDVDRRPELHWRKLDAADSYILKISKNENMSDPEIEKHDLEADTYQVVNYLDSGSDYYWQVICKNNKAVGIPSDIYKFTTNTESGIADFSYTESKKLQICPNPAESRIFIATEKPGRHYLAEVYDTYGRLLGRYTKISSGNSRIMLTKSEFGNATGMRFVRLSTEDGKIYSGKFFVMK